MASRLQLTSKLHGEIDWTFDPPGGELRFGVAGAEGARSGTWRLWAPKKKSDIYLVNRVIGSRVKVSLHESGDYRYQFDKDRFDRGEFPGVQNRAINQWPKPDEIGNGLRRAFYVIVPASEVTEGEYQPDDDRIMWIPKPEGDTAIMFHVLLTTPNKGGFELKGFGLLGAFGLANDDACLLVASRSTIEPEVREELERTRSRAFGSLPHEFLDRFNRPRMQIVGIDESGCGYLLELARDPVPVKVDD